MAKKKTSKSGGKYTKPELREQIKEDLKKSDKGARAGQWSARKSQMLASEYKKKGGGYTSEQDSGQKSLQQWTDEEWTTDDAKKARRGKKTSRYLPKKAWESLSAQEREETKQKKEAGSKQDRQYVDNTPAAAKSRKKARKATKKKTSKKKTTRKKTAKKAGKKSTAKRATRSSASSKKKKTRSKRTARGTKSER